MAAAIRSSVAKSVSMVVILDAVQA